MFQTETGAAPAGYGTGDTLSLTQNTPPNHSSPKVHRSQQDTLTANAHTTSCRMFPWELWEAADHNMKPITAVTLLFLSEQHPDTGAADSLSGSQPSHNRAGSRTCAPHAAADTWWTQRRTPKVRCYVEGALPNAGLCPCPADPAPSEASQPLPCCLACTKAGPLLCLGVFHELIGSPVAHPFNNRNYCQTAQINSLVSGSNP